MAQLTNLVSLYTGVNGFGNHPIPDFLAGLTNLRELSMKQNQLTGTIPTFLGALTDLQVLDLDFNQLEGPIPFELGRLTRMDTMMLNRNFLNGAIPDSFSALTSIGKRIRFHEEIISFSFFKLIYLILCYFSV